MVYSVCKLSVCDITVVLLSVLQSSDGKNRISKMAYTRHRCFKHMSKRNLIINLIFMCIVYQKGLNGRIFSADKAKFKQ